MAVTIHGDSSTPESIIIRGITYTSTNERGQQFVCYESHGGMATSEGGGNSAAPLTVGETYWFGGWATDDSNGGALTAYPYLIYHVNGSQLGWYQENVFPYATYEITYDANGGSGVPSSQTKTYGTPLTLSSTEPTRKGYKFVGWGTSAGDTTVDYSPGQSYTANSNATLYAIWELASSVVTIYDSDGNAHEGTVFIYDSNGVKHCAILTYYGQDGKAHKVV